MVLPFTKYILFRDHLFRKFSLLPRISQGHVCFEHFNPFLQKNYSSDHCERLSWERSTQEILLGKLKFALRNHQVHEAWESFQDFRSLYGYPEVHLVNQLIVQLSYSSNQVWMRKASDLVLQIVKEKSGLLHADTLTKLVLSLARLQMPSPASMILRLMLDKGCVPSMHLLTLVVFHIVKTEVGTYLAFNYLFQFCNFYNCLNDKKAHHAVTVKPDTLVFNLVLDACVRFKLSLKGLFLFELMSLSGTIADAHSIVIISQILEMNGLRDELKELKDHINGVSAAYVRHYRQFYDSLLSLHFKFNDIDSAAKLVLDMNSSHNCNVKKEYGKHLQSPCFIAIGSPNLRTAIKIHVQPELLNKDSVLKVESRQDLIFYRGGKLVLSNRALAKFIIGYKKDGRISELSKLLLGIQEELYSVAGSSLCFDVICACVQFGWLGCAHDILDDVEATGPPMGQDTYMLLVSAYKKGGMQKEAKALLKQMEKVGLDKGLSDDAIDKINKHNLWEETLNSLGRADLAIALAQILKDEDQTVFPLVYYFNSSIFFFCKARMIEDALKAYRRMVGMKVHPTSQTFAFLMSGYSSLGMYREITILWGDIKRFMRSGNLEGNRDLYELLVLNFLRGGYFERVMEVISHMRDHNMFTDKCMYKSEFLRFHKNLYRSLKASNTRTEAQSKRLEHVQEFRKWLGLVIDMTNTTRYYPVSDWTKEGIGHVKIRWKGREAVPDDESVKEFCDEIFILGNGFLLPKNKCKKEYILIHCTHGHNRTGYMIVHFLVHTESLSVTEAISKFSGARHPGIYKQDYTDALYTFYHEKKPEDLICPQTPKWKRHSDPDFLGTAVPAVVDNYARNHEQENIVRNEVLTCDDLMGDPIPPSQLRAMQEVCYQLLKLGTRVQRCYDQRFNGCLNKPLESQMRPPQAKLEVRCL